MEVSLVSPTKKVFVPRQVAENVDTNAAGVNGSRLLPNEAVDPTQPSVKKS
jgi:hypothetical protein